MPSTLHKLIVPTIIALFIALCGDPAFARIDYEFDEGVFSREVITPIVESPWTGSFASGLNGKSGNSDNLDINMTLNVARDTDSTNTTLLASYFYGSNEIATVTDRAFGQFRQERKFARNPKWSIYYQTALEWDRFKAFDYRIALHGGFGYEVYKLDDRFLKLRFGAGASREVGAVIDDWIPELQFGTDWERKLTERTRFFATVDFYPNLNDFSDYRLNTNGGVEFTLDAEKDINLRIFAFNRYDSTPAGGNTENDLDYGMALSLGF